jgi:hypothetical protein
MTSAAAMKAGVTGVASAEDQDFEAGAVRRSGNCGKKE